MTIYISRESDALSLIPNDNAMDIECAPDVYAYIEKERPLYLHEIEGIYFDKDAQEVRFNTKRAPLLFAYWQALHAIVQEYLFNRL